MFVFFIRFEGRVSEKVFRSLLPNSCSLPTNIRIFVSFILCYFLKHVYNNTFSEFDKLVHSFGLFHTAETISRSELMMAVSKRVIQKKKKKLKVT